MRKIKYNPTVGEKYNHLTVLRKDETKKNHWICECDCKNKTIISVRQDHLCRGETKSCGCYRKKINTYNLTSYEYGVGITTNTNKEFYFDLEDYDLICNYCWYEDIQKGYISANSSGKIIFLHRLVMGNPTGKDIDHIRHNKYDNRKSSLRICEHQQNSMNCKIKKNNTSGYSGISYSKDRNKWRAQIGYKNQRILIGYYDNKDDAVEARRLYEENLFKEWSYKNSMIEVDDEKET